MQAGMPSFDDRYPPNLSIDMASNPELEQKDKLAAACSLHTLSHSAH